MPGDSTQRRRVAKSQRKIIWRLCDFALKPQESLRLDGCGLAKSDSTFIDSLLGRGEARLHNKRLFECLDRLFMPPIRRQITPSVVDHGDVNRQDLEIDHIIVFEPDRSIGQAPRQQLWLRGL